ncbi:hypothetical protein GFB56_09965 [Ensifer sp. T173]|uniref:Uncharacterized protein n=1 Tax=Ensifer canadensis TaxID=555315 RepID=A0AAW4FGB4_9HYPH|nr:hypothetical protein [Ensifer canadensis]MBM3091142.1 hypothetical protein [Ensifer canadensis]UBI78671.1 hypothetical protein J3R84_21245 [Ensifer canadensis]
MAGDQDVCMESACRQEVVPPEAGGAADLSRGHLKHVDPTVGKNGRAADAVRRRALEPGRLRADMHGMDIRRGHDRPENTDFAGGDMAAAMAIGRLVRRNGLSVAVGRTVFAGCQPDQEGCTENDNRGADYVGAAVSRGRCAQACTLVLAAGVRRLAGDGTAIEAIPIVAASEAGTKKLAAYYGEMGVRYQVLVDGPRNEDGNLGRWQLFKALLVTSTLAVDQLVDAQICRGTPAPNNCRVFTTMDLE